MQRKYFATISLMVLGLFCTTIHATPPENLSYAKKNVITYYDSGQHEQDVKNAISDAENYLYQRIDENSRLTKPRKLAVVMDIDDTSLSNYLVYKQTDFGQTHEMVINSFKQASAPAIKPVLEFYNKAVRSGVTVFFVSLRPEYFRNETIINLQKAGYYGWKAIYLPTKHQAKLPAQAFKTGIRKHLSQQGYHIILTIGDQESDLKGGYAEKTIRIPNPLYTHID